MWKQILPGLRVKLFMTVVLGVIYPLAMTGISQLVFPKQANGSLIMSGGKVIGSEIIGQSFTKPEYFHPRPSAAGSGYDATASSSSNLGPTSSSITTASTFGSCTAALKMKVPMNLRSHWTGLRAPAAVSTMGS